jgi:protein-S-isoprenylcysteine O-methyltransferase Ste14
MTVTAIVATLIRLIWALFEWLRLQREPQRGTTEHDKHSARVWDVAIGLEVIGMVLGLVGVGRIQTSTNLIGYFGLVALVGGIAIRWSAIYTLGKYFTGKVRIQSDHQLVRVGLYKYVRHPAYSGSLLAHLGLGLSFGNWFTLGFSVIPFVVAVWYRMRVEDAALQKAFGVAYLDYSKQAKRLIPKLY